MRRIRLRIRLKRPGALAASDGDRVSATPAENLPGREFPPVPDGRAVPQPWEPEGELSPREGPAGASSQAGRPRVLVSPDMAEGKPRIPGPGSGRPPRRPGTSFQPALPILDAQPAAQVESDLQTDSVEAPASPAAGESKPIREHGAVSNPACPTCGEALVERPHMKTTCPACGKGIHVRGGQKIFSDGLVPDDEVDAVDLMERLDSLGITQEMCLQGLEKDERNRPRAGALAARLRELCEERLPELLPATQVRLLHEMARESQWRSEDPRPLLRRAQVILLQKMRDAGATRVRMACSGSDACPACRELTGRSLTIEEALSRQMLPNADCRHPGGLCRCHYAEVVTGTTGETPAR